MTKRYMPSIHFPPMPKGCFGVGGGLSFERLANRLRPTAKRPTNAEIRARVAEIDKHAYELPSSNRLRRAYK